MSREIVAVHGRRPKRVYATDDTCHYFYWDWDFYRRFDYEPVAVHNHSGGKIVFSRFHWHCATLWTEPIDVSNKPAVRFSRAIHTPIIKSNSDDCRYVEMESVSTKERFAIVSLYIPLFLGLLKRANFDEPVQSYVNLIEDEEVPERYVFDLSKIKSVLIIGRFPKPEELPHVLRIKLWEE